MKLGEGGIVLQTRELMVKLGELAGLLSNFQLQTWWGDYSPLYYHFKISIPGVCHFEKNRTKST